jgi:phosphoserine phosphatase
VPIALNPNKELEKLAKKRGWKILRENDDVIRGIANAGKGVEEL